MKGYIRNCARRNIFWNLTLEAFKELTSQPCIYCGCAPAQKSRSYTYNGIDRIEHKKGYELPNCVPSCGTCNFIRGTRLTFEEMKAVGKALQDFRRKK